MTELDRAIAAAYASQGKQQDVNVVYLTLLKSTLFVPTQKGHQATEETPFSPLFTQLEGRYFMIAFDRLERLNHWAGEYADHMSYVELLGMDIVKGLNEPVYFCLNIGSAAYKEFSPDEIRQLKKIAARIEQLKHNTDGCL